MEGEGFDREAIPPSRLPLTLTQDQTAMLAGVWLTAMAGRWLFSAIERGCEEILRQMPPPRATP